MLCGARILVAEDEAFIVMCLEDAIIDAGGIVVGPATMVDVALRLIDAEEIDAAILDMNLTDGEATPIACCLAARGIPLVAFSATGLPDRLRAIHPDLPVIQKPASMERVLLALTRAMAGVPQAAVTERPCVLPPAFEDIS